MSVSLLQSPSTEGGSSAALSQSCRHYSAGSGSDAIKLAGLTELIGAAFLRNVALSFLDKFLSVSLSHRGRLQTAADILS